MALGELSCTVDADGRCFIRWRGRVVRVLTGRAARKVIAAMAVGEREAQLAMAATTGNFKRGNERR